MLFDQHWPTIPGRGWLTQAEGRALWGAAQRTEGDILEIGQYHGRSTCLLAALGRQIHAVDPFRDFDDADMSGDSICAAFHENLAARGIQNVRQYRVKVEDWEPVPCGFAFCDGDHTFEGTRAQIQAAKATGAKLLAVHDYALTGGDGGGRAIAAAVAVEGLKVLELVDTLAVCEVVPCESD